MAEIGIAGKRNDQVSLILSKNKSQMSLASRLGDRFKYAFGAQVVSAVTGALLAVILARLLDPDSYGLLFLAISVFTIGKLMSVFGIPKSASRFIAEYKEGDRGQVPHVLRFAFLYNLLTVSIVSTVFVIFGDRIAVLIGAGELGSIAVLGGLFIIFGTLTAFVRAALQGFEEIQTASTFKIIHKIGRLILVIGFVLAGFEVIGALAGYVLGFAFVSSSGLVYIYATKYRISDVSTVESGLNRRIFNYSIPIAFTQSSHVIDNHLDKVLIGLFAGPAAVGFYTIGKQVVNMIQTPMSALGFTLSPTYGAEKAKGNSGTAAKIFETAFSQSLLVYIPAAAGLVLVAEPTIVLVFGAEYSDAVPILQVLSVLVVLQTITKLTSHGLDYLGRARARAIAKAIAAISNVILNVLLIPVYGALGAAVATVITFSFYTFVNVWIMHSELDLRLTYLSKHIGYTTVVTVVMSGIVIYTAQYITGFVTLFAVVGIGIAVWLPFAFAFGLIDTNKARAFFS
ncbi:oligosaccharide flippase family protein [Natrarchaeobius oligotrophus]|uniref:Flippase n=1 Tax=Natrarchaeobius chitinivorans TaxID=1679083 RepID=A0A3N6PFA0_NATCH|nr:oligosaccharide flippase family protein [Natrarchaeobius chitinivorans]RQG96185.1 flippase [Natrarchaeobius chitinivorans]